MVKELDKSIPAIYLVPCDWMQYFEDDQLLEVSQVIKLNAQRHRNCYIRHNGLIQLLKEHQQ